MPAAPPARFEAPVKLSPAAAALDDDALRPRLCGAGVALATRSDDVVTGHFGHAQVEALLALDIVTALQVASKVQRR